MVFSSALFLFKFFPIIIGTYILLREKYRNIFLLLVSLFFYAWGEPKYVILLLLSICINYLYGFIIDKIKQDRLWLRKIIFAFICIIDLGILFVFKYLNFFVDSLNRLLKINLYVKNITLPIGISFFTFQILSYVIDVYRGEVKVQKNILNLGLYITLFPQLIAGPIVRYKDIDNEIDNRNYDINDFYSGIKRFILGLAKKVIIADNMAMLADKIINAGGVNALIAWVGMLAYMIQIYYDFSGYSDMAIGMGRMFGFHFNENFNYPYISKSIKEFWKRWHISLSIWFRDYVYIPLGGSRCSNAKSFRNLMIVFLLTGIWHGASWNFVLWGMYYGIILILERICLLNWLKRFPDILQHLYVVIVVSFGWILFRVENISATIGYYRMLFDFHNIELYSSLGFINIEYIVLFGIGIVCATPIPYNFLERKGNKAILTNLIYIILLVLAVLYMAGKDFSPFLYFRF